jgi:hypothetical protein
MQIKVDTSKFEGWAKLYAEEFGVMSTDVLRYHTRLLYGAIIENLPPFGKKKDAKSTGEKAVKRDIQNALSLLEADKFTNPSIKKMIQKKEYDKLNKVLDNLPSKSGLFKKIAVRFDKNIIQDARDPRTGNIYGKKTSTVTLDKQPYNKNIRELLSHVGRLKSMFVNGFLALGGKGVTSWIARHAGFKSKFSDYSNSAIPTLINESDIYNYPLVQKAIKGAIVFREKQIFTDYKRRIRLANKGDFAAARHGLK